ncbi:MAG TPA: DUF4339 domain-containing protein [Alphaproteobacteria bacterium]|nr:DUF4339 domain-containing protein [Alphaproteobacteria bacterium]
MDIFIGRNGSVIGPYEEDEILRRLDDDRLDGTELAWHEGLDEWVKVKELLEDKAPVPEAEETSMETESAEEPEPLDEETLLQVNKIKELIADGHTDTALQLVCSLNNPHIFEELLEGSDYFKDRKQCSIICVPQCMKGHADFFIKLLGKLPEGTQIDPELKQFTGLNLADNKIRDLDFLTGLKQLTWLILSDNEITDLTPLAELKELKELYLQFNRITDVSPLAELTKLEKLVLGEFRLGEKRPGHPWSGVIRVPETNSICNLKTLSGLKELKSLTLYCLGGQYSHGIRLAEMFPQCSIELQPTDQQLHTEMMQED